MKIGIGDAVGSVPVDVVSRSPFVAVVPSGRTAVQPSSASRAGHDPFGECGDIAEMRSRTAIRLPAPVAQSRT
jgi:hypothetical protein